MINYMFQMPDHNTTMIGCSDAVQEIYLLTGRIMEDLVSTVRSRISVSNMRAFCMIVLTIMIALTAAREPCFVSSVSQS